MITVSISQLKANPSSVIHQSAEYPVMVKNRDKVQAYVVGKTLFEKVIAMLEDKDDAAAVRSTDFSQGENFEDVAKALDI